MELIKLTDLVQKTSLNFKKGKKQLLSHLNIFKIRSSCKQSALTPYALKSKVLINKTLYYDNVSIKFKVII